MIFSDSVIGEEVRSPDLAKVSNEIGDVLRSENFREGGVGTQVGQSAPCEGRAVAQKVLCVFTTKQAERTRFLAVSQRISRE